MTILLIERLVCAPTYTEGALIWRAGPDPTGGGAGVVLASILEDPDRGLDAGDPSTWDRKVYADTAIPTTPLNQPYSVGWDYSKRFKRDVLRIFDVPTHEGCLFHGGNNTDDTKGCPICADEIHNGVIPFGRTRPAVRRVERWFSETCAREGVKRLPLYVVRRTGVDVAIGGMGR